MSNPQKAYEMIVISSLDSFKKLVRCSKEIHEQLTEAYEMIIISSLEGVWEMYEMS